MKRIFVVAALALFVTAATYFAFSITRGTLVDCPCTGWLREEFSLDDATCARVMSAQAEFERHCHGHCREVAEAKTALAAVPASASAEVRTAAANSVSAAERRCLDARVEHAHRIAGMLPEAQRAKYLDLVLPRLKALDHTGPADVSGSR